MAIERTREGWPKIPQFRRLARTHPELHGVLKSIRERWSDALSLSTANNYIHVIRRLMEWKGTADENSLTVDDVRNFYLSLADDLTDTAKISMRSALRFYWCQDREFASDPLAGFQPLIKSKDRLRPVSENVLRRVIRRMTLQEQVVIELIWRGGWTVQTLVDLRMSDVFFTRRGDILICNSGRTEGLLVDRGDSLCALLKAQIVLMMRRAPGGMIRVEADPDVDGVYQSLSNRIEDIFLFSRERSGKAYDEGFAVKNDVMHHLNPRDVGFRLKRFAKDAPYTINLTNIRVSQPPESLCLKRLEESLLQEYVRISSPAWKEFPS